ncbi:Holliday junction resolvase RuvX [Patescibacteria group bacterium]|nr:Holliday junction resolvase RuvX [Patescibacteria group bacterium]
MNILGIDFGTKNIGLAWVDTGIGAVLPYGRITNKEKGKRNIELVELIKGENIDKVVIGLPMGLDGSENVNTNRVHAFAKELEPEIGMPVEFVNEMFSSQMGDRMEGGVSRDEKAAMVILEDYLAGKNSKFKH